MECSKTYDPQLVLNSIYNGIVSIDSEGIITYFNKTAEKMFNTPAHEALGQYILDVLPNTGGKLLECLKRGKPFYGVKLRGEKVTLISNINPIVTKGNYIGSVSVFQDISEIENISQELDLFKNMKTWLDAIIDSSYDGLCICDHQGKIIRINKASERINEIEAERVIGKNMNELVGKGLFDKSVTLEVLKRKTLVTMIQQIQGKKMLLVTGNPIFNENGEITFVVTNERDVTDLDNLRVQIQETKALAEGYISKLSELEMKGINLNNIFFRSEKMDRIIQLSLRVAKVDSTVLLLGDSGVGKGLIAKLIHKNSDRNNGPFIRVDCAGIPDSLLESELFGYEKGAFTGAKNDGKPGLFELANNGTLFLDEIAELPMSSQAKLLRFLEDHEIIRVGGTDAKQINARIVAATNKNIEEMVTAKVFRKDLFYRLNIIPIYIPPLRERREDILSLIIHFLGKFNQVYQKKKVISPEATAVLCRYDFPGNTRELANLMERLVVITEKDRIDIQDLPFTMMDSPVKDASLLNFPEDIPLKEAVDRCERFVIEKTLKKYGSQRKAAKVLKIDHATLARKMKKSLPSEHGAVLHHAVHQ